MDVEITMRPLALLLISLATLGRGEVRFNRDIRPIFSDTCFRCHGQDKNSRMAGLRLDLRDEALKPNKSGAAPIVPGDPGRSAIVQRVFATNPALQMPPKFAHKDLTAKQKDLIRDWVAEGANYEGHWAYQPIKRPPLPGTNAAQPIDAFIRSRLARENLKPSPEADRRTLLRRVSLDLTGLPPSPREIDDFLKDTAPNAYEKVVDRLLASPSYAEKQALHWLDAVRYADTVGFHGDNPFPAWPYRDYVLKAFRDNMPFDRFTREQLAGDLFPNAAIDQRTASAFNRMNRTSAEGGLQPKEYLAKYAADRVRAVAAVWLGSTVGCAECHDHKFDPFTSKDFYSLKAFFADIQETGLVPDRGEKAFGSKMAIPSEEQRARLEDLNRRIAAITAKPVGDPVKLPWKFQRPLEAKSANGAILRIYNEEPVDATQYTGPSLVSDRKPGNGLVIASGPNPDNETYSVTFRPGAGVWSQLGIEVVQDESLPSHRVARGADRLSLTEVDAELGAPARKLEFVHAVANLNFPSRELPAMAAIDGDPKTGWGVFTYGDNKNLFLALRFSQPVETSATSSITVRLHHDSDFRRATIGRFRLALLTDDPKDTFDPAQAELARLDAERNLLEAAIPRVVVTEAVEPAETRILPRGNFLDESGETVAPAIPAVFGKLSTEGRATRLDLAHWLASRDNPLTARVFVNRAWRQLFGIGLSKVLDDIGSQGEWPVHSELLDWLAAEFMDSGWNVKNIFKTIVMSETYRQSSSLTPELAQKDPDNRLLARQSRYRVDAEIVRDIALSVSGLLVEKFGGPSVNPYQPEGYLAALNFPKREYSASKGENQYRRGIYTFWQRTFLHPSMTAFDAPSREECTVNRTSSNTPLQALVLLNDPTYVEASRFFAQGMLKDGGPTLAQRLDWAFLRALGRKPVPEERRILSSLYQKSLLRYQNDSSSARQLIGNGEAPVLNQAGPADLAALTTVARAILNLHETITRN